MTTTKLKKIFAASALLMISCFAGDLRAAVYIYDLNTVVTGSTPSGPSPWATATFTDNGANTVNLNMSFNSGGDSTEFISKWLFNFSGDADNLAFSRTGSVGTIGTVNVSTSDGGENAGAGYKFDISFDFPLPAPSGRFNSGESITYEITGSGINASLFDFPSTKKNSPDYTTMAHVQGLDNGKSGWIGDGDVPIPEPSTYLMLGSMLGLVLLITAKKRKALKNKMNS